MSSTNIQKVRGRRVWDSRGFPTVEVEVELAGGASGRAIAPAGASCGSREATELRDGGSSLGGKDVSRALSMVEQEISPALRGLCSIDQAGVDARLVELDGTGNMGRLGGNTSVATSLAVLHAAAAERQVPLWRHLAASYGRTPTLPLPEVQIFGGGAHASGRIDIQDFMIMVPGAATFDEAMRVTAEIYHAAGALMAERGALAGVADEGGWWPSFSSNEEALEVLIRAIEAAGEVPGERVVISLDVAASQLRHGGLYRLALEDSELDGAAMVERFGQWIQRYPIAAVEDPLAEDDDEGFIAFTRAFGSQIQVVGDDYLVTDATRVRRAAEAGACNTALIKVNQNGTVSGAVAALDAAQGCGWNAIVSARSGETEDVSISHLAVGLGAGQLKVGSFSRSERMAKWNECLRIEESIGASGSFVGGQPLADTWWGRANASSLRPAAARAPQPAMET
jgi:enolase